MNKPNIVPYVIEIRKLAALHQSGTPFGEVKIRVDFVIQSIEDLSFKDKDFQFRLWSDLLFALEKYITVMAHPQWLDVIAHARNKIKIKRKNLKVMKKIIT